MNYGAVVHLPTPGAPDLTIVIPTYNERERLGELVERALFRDSRGRASSCNS